MKKLIPCLLLALNITNATAQKYIPLPTADVTWIQRQGNNDTIPSFYIVGMKGGDTTIAGHAYHKLYRSVHATLDEGTFIGGLREDGAKHIYFYNPPTSSERLLYDFSLSIGDTIKDPATGEASGIVNFIDSVLLSGVYHKRFNFGRYPSGEMWTGGAWIEGIGNSSLGGLLGSPMAQPTCDCSTETICFKEGNDWQYHNDKYGTLNCINVLQAPVITAHEIKVILYPNPVVNTSMLYIDGNASYYQLVICNMQGRIEKSIAVHDREHVPVGKDDCPVGMHIYHLQDDKGNVTTGKFIVE